MSFENKTVIVTGAASGIGRATATLFATRGAQVIAIDRDEKGLATLSEEVGTSLRGLHADLTSEGLDEALLEVLSEMDGELSVLVNNAGIGGGSRLDETSDDILRQYLEINLVSLFHLSRIAIGEMRRSGGGAIVNLASIYSVIGATQSSAYSASKGAVAALTRQMATDYGPEGIRVNAVAPGLIETPLTTERIHSEPWRHQIFIEQSPLRCVGQPGDVARAIAFLASDEARFVSGETLRVDGGWAMGRYPRPEIDL